jgi:hypothetical protein
MEDVSQVFEERLQEIEAYLDLLEAIEQQVQQGLPKIGVGALTSTVITVQQQKILYSSVYLQLYNLIESTVVQCLNTVSKVIVDKNLQPSDLSTNLRREWVQSIARTHTDLGYDKRLESALELFDHIVKASPMVNFNLEKGGGGNWDDVAIYKLSQRLGLSLNISNKTHRDIKQPFRDDKGALVLIKSLRNKLAHGDLSFAECGENITAHDLRQLTDRVALYMREVVACFKSSIDAHEFLQPARRPTGAGA